MEKNETGGACNNMVMGRSVYRALVGKSEGNRLLVRPRLKWKDNFKKDLQELGCGCMDWIDLAQSRDSWRAWKCGNEPLFSIKYGEFLV
jgi:hypothetical protein